MPKRSVDIVGDPILGHHNSPGEPSNPPSLSTSSKRRRQSLTNATTTLDDTPNPFLSRNVSHLLLQERIQISSRRKELSPDSRLLSNLKVWCSEKWTRIKSPSLLPLTLSPKPFQEQAMDATIPPQESPDELQEPGIESARRSSTRPRRQSTRHPEEEVVEYEEEALVVSGKRSSFKSFGPNTLLGFMYRKMFEVDFTILAGGEGYEIVRTIGLHEFLKISVPRLDKNLCDEFLGTFDDRTNSGKVRGRLVVLDAESVARASKLPLGDKTPRAEVACAQTEEQGEAIGRMRSERKKCRGYNISEVVYGRRTEIFKKLACMLSIKLQCRKECFHFAGEEVVLALDRSIRDGVKMRWAEYLCNTISRACRSKPTNNSIIFQFGEWLSKIIRNKLQEPVEGDDYEGLIAVPLTVDRRGGGISPAQVHVDVIDRAKENGGGRGEVNPESSPQDKEIDSLVTVKQEEPGMSIVPFVYGRGKRQGASEGRNGRYVIKEEKADNARLREELRREVEKVRELREKIERLEFRKDKGLRLLQSLVELYA